jgi:hypothetical protein
MNNKMKQLVKNRSAEAIIFCRSDYRDRKSRTSALQERGMKIRKNWNEMKWNGGGVTDCLWRTTTKSASFSGKILIYTISFELNTEVTPI